MQGQASTPITFRCAIIVATLLLLQACANAPPAPPPEPDATSAVISDTAIGGGGSGGKFFSVEKINGASTPTNVEASRRASYGRGFDLRVETALRKVPAGKVRLQLTARVAYGAPIQELIASARSRMYTATGTIEVEIEPNKRYRVTGALDELRNEVWLEEQDSGRMIGTKIIGPPSDEAVRAMAAEAMFTCCNLHYDPKDDNWISDANWVALPMIPAGSPIRVYEFKKDRAKAMIQGAPMWLGIDYGSKPPLLSQYVARLAVKDDPAPRLASYPPSVQQAIRAGKIAMGMTKDQLLMSVGYPTVEDTPSLQASAWTYRAESESLYNMRWNAEGRVDGIEADGPTLQLVLFVPSRATIP